MSFTFVAENEEAEKLLNYLISYRNSVATSDVSVQEESTIPIDKISMGVITQQTEKIPKIETPKSKVAAKAL